MFFVRQTQVAMNTDFKVMLTVMQNKLVKSRNLPMLFPVKNELIVQLAQLHKFVITTELLSSKNASLIFQKETQRIFTSSCGPTQNRQSDSG